MAEAVQLLEKVLVDDFLMSEVLEVLSVLDRVVLVGSELRTGRVMRGWERSIGRRGEDVVDWEDVDSGQNGNDGQGV